MARPGGIEPHAVHPTLRIGLEDQCRARSQSEVIYRFDDSMLPYQIGRNKVHDSIEDDDSKQ